MNPANQPNLDPAAPVPGHIADELFHRMLATEKPTSIAWAVVRDQDDEPLYAVAIVMGRQNVADALAHFQEIQQNAKPVELFEEEPECKD